MELIFCGKRDARVVLVLYKYCPYFRDFVGICSNLVFTWRRLPSCPDHRPDILLIRYWIKEIHENTG